MEYATKFNTKRLSFGGGMARGMYIRSKQKIEDYARPEVYSFEQFYIIMEAFTYFCEVMPSWANEVIEIMGGYYGYGITYYQEQKEISDIINKNISDEHFERFIKNTSFNTTSLFIKADKVRRYKLAITNFNKIKFQKAEISEEEIKNFDE